MEAIHSICSRFYTSEGQSLQDILDGVDWQNRKVEMKNINGEIVFAGTVSFPSFWTDNAVNITASRYFYRGEKYFENSLADMIKRVVGRLGELLYKRYPLLKKFDKEQEDKIYDIFTAELGYILLHQISAFNSPVYFNLGISGKAKLEHKEICSACQPYHSLVKTLNGFAPIGEIVRAFEQNNDPNIAITIMSHLGPTDVVAVKQNGIKEVFRITLKDGLSIDLTSDHLVALPGGKSWSGKFVPVSSLTKNDSLCVTRNVENNPYTFSQPESHNTDISTAAIIGWLQSDGYVGKCDSATSLKVEMITVNNNEEAWINSHWSNIFPQYTPTVTCVETKDTSLDCKRHIVHGEKYRRFAEEFGLLDRGTNAKMPRYLLSASLDECTAYLRSMFQAEGYVGRQDVFNNDNLRIVFSIISEDIARNMQKLLMRFGIHSRYRKYNNKGNKKPSHTITIASLPEIYLFNRYIGFIGKDKQEKVNKFLQDNSHIAVNLNSYKTIQIKSIESIGDMPVYDIQTDNGEYISEGIRVHNCFLVDINDNMESVKEFGNIEFDIFRGGSGSGGNFSKLRGSMETIRGGGTSSGPVSFMKIFDAQAGKVRSGGRLRRAAIMRVLDCDHPDIYDFITSKVIEENKAKALVEAGFSDGIDGEANGTVAFQNENHSVRITDEFMKAAINDKDFKLKYRKNISPDGTSTHSNISAKHMMHMIAKCAHQCGDPGLQFKDTINKWNTIPNSGEIESSNPCLTLDSHILTIDGYKTLESLLDKGQFRVLIPCLLGTNNYSIQYENFTTALTDERGIYKTGTQQVFKVKFSNGYHQRFTNNHEIKTKHSGFVELKNIEIGTEIENIYNKIITIISIEKDGIEDVYDITVPLYGYFVCGGGCIVHNCSEVFNISDTSCNLSSMNLVQFVEHEHEYQFNFKKLYHVAHIMTIAQDLIVDFTEYPHERIRNGTANTRNIGLGITNLGNLFMILGIPYDSDEARYIAATIMSGITSEAYKASAMIGGMTSPFPFFEKNKIDMAKVLDLHKQYLININIPDTSDSAKLTYLIKKCTMEIKDHKKTFSALSNSIADGTGKMAHCYVSSAAPAGTISFMMDATTTGIEPELGLIKYKRLVGGDTIKIVNNSIKHALYTLGYDKDQIEEVMDYILEHETIEGAPYVSKEHYKVFQCSIGQSKDLLIKPHGHLKMVAAIQPVISQGISKTINVSEETTVEEIEDLYISAWKMDLKCISVYRDNSKNSQPLMVSKSSGNKDKEDIFPNVPVTSTVFKPYRKPMPETRKSITHKFSIVGHEGYLTIGLYENGQPGEIFIVMAKTGSFTSGIIDCFATTVSLGLQYGVPLRHLIEKFKGTTFEPHGITQNKNIQFASSIVDYVGKFLENEFIEISDDNKEQQSVNVDNEEFKKFIDHGITSYNVCSQCGALLVKAGTCEACPSCGTTTGCS